MGPCPRGNCRCVLQSIPPRLPSQTPANDLLATAQSLHDRQMNFLAKEGELARKPEDEITRDDVADIQKKEVR